MGIKVGISAWTEKTLVESGWYPRDAKDAESRLRFYASRFPLVEVDAPYYGLPSREQAEAWAERTPEGFTFDVKAFALLTGHYTDPKRLPADLRGELPEEARVKPRLYPRDVPRAIVDELGRRFVEALEPLKAAGKLGVVLLQYPVWFPRAQASFHELERAGALLPGLRLAVEFRNATWLTDQNRERTLAFLREQGLAYVSVDEPQGFPSSVPPIASATGRVSVVRFHGRNRRTWSRRTETAAQRFDYRYSLDELREWVPRIGELAAASAEVHAVMNNCHRDHAVVNAQELTQLLADAGLPAALSPATGAHAAPDHPRL